MKIIHLSDLHLVPPGVRLGHSEPDAVLGAALDDIARRHGDADLLVITGDLVHRGDGAGYRRLAEGLAGLGVPLALTIGNHDDRAAFLAAFPAHGAAGFAQAVWPLAGARALILDTVEEGGHAGLLCPARLGWAEAALEATTDPVFLFMHHNPIRTHLPAIDRIMLRESHRFADLVRRFRDRIALIAHGHTHLPMAGALHGVPVVCCRGMSLAGYPNYGEDRLLPHAALPATYSVILAEGAEWTAMTVEFGHHIGGIDAPAQAVEAPG